MIIIRLFFEVLGIGWLILSGMIFIWGGSIKIKIINPLNKNIDTITDITIDK